MKKYYLHNGTENIGPFDLDELKSKGITKSTQVWCEGMDEWKKAGDISDLQSILSSTPPPIKKVEPPVYKKSKGLNIFQKIGLVMLLFIIGAMIKANIDNSNDGMPSNEMPSEASSFVGNNEEINKREIRNGIESLVSVYTNKYSVDPFGGITNLDVTFVNKTDYLINECEAEVSYIQENGDIFKTEFLTFNNIAAHQDKSISAPDSNRGLSVDVKITSVNSEKLDLCYSIFLPNKAGDVDPYKCK